MAKPPKNRETNRAVGDFFRATEAAACRSQERAVGALNAMLSGNSASRMVNGVVFDVPAELDQQALKIAMSLSGGLGPVAGDEGALLTALWKEAASRLSKGESVETATDNFLQHIEATASQSLRYIAANSLLVLERDVERFEVGPVAVTSGEWLRQNLEGLRQGATWSVDVGRPGLRLDAPGAPGAPIIGVSPFNWDVSAVAAKENLEEEAAWLSGVAVTFLRITAGDTLGMLVGKLGQVDPHPFRREPGETTAITIQGSSLSTGRLWMPPQYRISAATVERASRPEFQTIVTSVFFPNKKSVAERMRQSLGWVARGRQAQDRAERFLYFFTALEALLSSDDKTAPVVQTIARNAATILDNEPRNRLQNAKLVKDLYAARSALVHAGARGVTRRQANTIENVAELVCWRVLDQVDLNTSVQAFQKELSDASYGLPWGGDKDGRLPNIDDPVEDN